MHSLFFSLIQLSIGNRYHLLYHPSVEEWKELYQMALKHSLVGICCVGVKKYLEICEQDGVDTNLSRKNYFQWVGVADQIQQRNILKNSRCIELQTRLHDYGINSSILKGQGIADLYGDLKKFRVSGDIDVYVNCNRESIIEYARSINQENMDWDYKHLHLKIYKDTEVEVHYRPEVLFNLVKNWRLQRWFLSEETQRQIFQQNGQFVAPSIEFNIFYILLHIYRHFLYGGVGLRQLMDYYYVLKTISEQDYKSNAKHVIETFGLKRFAKGVMWIMQTVFGLDKRFLLYEPNEMEGQYILSQVMISGNFGHFDERLKSVSGQGKFRTIKKILTHNIYLLTHYPAEVIWVPIWILFHWCWKRLVR